jgi:SAM-dependent methyltransferase
MTKGEFYDIDLAYVHDQGFGGFAVGAAPGLLRSFRRAGINHGRIVDLGCGSGLWARKLVDAGYEVVGVDQSPAMIEIARQRVPEAEFQVGSFVSFTIPPCRAVTALGEVFNYLFDAANSLASVAAVCRRAYSALAPGGLLIFDVAESGRCRERTQAFAEGADWACLVDYRHDDAQQQLTRRIVTFRKVGDVYRRHEEIHRQQLFDQASIMTMLESVGFHASTVRSYGDYALADHVLGVMARKPAE